MNRHTFEIALFYTSFGATFCSGDTSVEGSCQFGQTWEEVAAEKEVKRRAREKRRQMKLEKARKKRE